MVLDEFIDQNHNLEKQFQIFQNLSLSPSNGIISFEKNTLKQIELSNGEFISELKFEKLCVASFEGDLLGIDKEMFDTTVSNNIQAESIFNEYSKLRFNADLNITMPNKASLKKRMILPFIDNRAIYIPAVAASIAFFVLYYVYPNISDNSSNSSFNNSINNNAITEVITINTTKVADKDYKEILNSATDITVEKTIAKSSVQPKNNKTSKTTRIVNNRIRTKYSTPKQFDAIACCKNIGPDKALIQNGMQLMIVRPELAYNEVDSGYFLVVAPEYESAIAKIVPKGLKKVGKRIGNIFSEKKAIIESEKAITTIEGIAQVALNGFNKMTESDYSFRRNQSSDNIEEEK